MAGTDLRALAQATAKAKSKGSREALIFYKENAYVMNVKSNTLITAVDRTSMKGNVFTNIDCTVFV